LKASMFICVQIDFQKLQLQSRAVSAIRLHACKDLFRRRQRH
jgi:hypothetical protein